jgi:hypothetical protein
MRKFFYIGVIAFLITSCSQQEFASADAPKQSQKSKACKPSDKNCVGGPSNGGSGPETETDPKTGNGLSNDSALSKLQTDSVSVNDGIGRIVCTKTDLLPKAEGGSTDLVYTRDFSVAECGGKQPNAEFFAFSASEEICGADRDWTIMEPRNGKNPGISVRYLGACPGPVNASLISVVWVHRDSALAQGETSAVSADQLRERIKSRASTITCRKTDFNPGTQGTSSGINITFAASECTGSKLPDSSYVGLLSKRLVCGLNESWTQPAPGRVSFWYLGGIQPCANASERSDIEVLYIKVN